VLVLARAVSAAVEATLDLDSVADDLATTVLADRGQPVGRTLEAVEDVMLSGGDDLEGLVVLVSAYFAPTHEEPPDVESLAPPVSTQWTNV
jgi:hypothetical protein